MEAKSMALSEHALRRHSYYGILALLALVGLVAIGVRLTEGMRVTALSSPMAWGMWVAFYIYFIGLSAGSFLLSTLIYVFGMHQYEKVGRMALLSALFALVAGMLFVWIDLGHPWRFWKVFTRWNYTSVLAWEVLAYLFYIATLGIELWALMRCDLAHLALTVSGWRGKLYRFLTFRFRCPESEAAYRRCHAQSMRVVRILGIIGIPVAIMVHGGTGAIFAVVAAKPYWYTGLFPIIFLVSALASGAALMTFLYAFFGRKDEEHLAITRGMANLMVLFLCIDLLLLTSEFLVGLYGKIPEHIRVYHAILFGPFPYTFWLGQLLVGALIPIALATLPRTRNNIFWLGLGGLSAVIGIVAVRLNLVVPAYVVPVLEGLEHAINQPRWAYTYFPSFWEWASSIGTIALVVLLFSLAFQFLPMFHEFPQRFQTPSGSKEVKIGGDAHD
jgi:molybdopterin-containing oxidoreductase family membrane subunit